jgi:tripartite-type tricarboxylate transporter receptor subunit TctC
MMATGTPLRRRVALAWLSSTVLGAHGAARAQAWPSRPVRVVVPFAAGGLTDVLTRSVGEVLGPLLGQPIAVENRPGAAGHVAAEYVARGPADGYQLAMLGAGHAGGAAYSTEPMRYDLLRDFTAIGMLGFSPSLLIARKALNVRNFPELVALARARPGQISFAAVQTYTVEYMQAMAGVEFNMVLYKGASQATNDMLGERVDLMLGTVSDMLQLLQSGKFQAVALNSPQRLPQLPDVAPVADHLPGYRGGQWYGLFAPAATAQPVVAKMRADLAKAVKQPAYVAALTKLSMLQPDLDVDAFAAEVAATLESFQRARRLGKPAPTSPR